ncbi:hypothetical protein SUNI508_06509 [Seiridium unicorne]|uniref:Zn(2)-C6 fungal-type domain-containing protein n=1 Tax=Seiridium unicorne TaxID=138068 RepID=A0ABR2V189_9PEZI
MADSSSNQDTSRNGIQEGRVRCDGSRPSCQRCINRNEICEGYRDEASLIFRYETKKVIEHARASASSLGSNSPSSTLRRSRSVDGSPNSTQSPLRNSDPTDLTKDEMDSLNYQFSQPWLKSKPGHSQSTVQDEAAASFMGKYVIYPCNETSSPGFLEHLPSLFKDVNVEGRHALRWAVRAAGYADISKDSDNNLLARKAYHCYGLALAALGESLAEPGKTPDDYDLMTVVVLDIFETLFLPDTARNGAHAQGMAQILRLRGTDQVCNPRGWSLFRLAHHRIQKQQLALGMPQIDESRQWLDQLNEEIPFVHNEKDGLKIKETCDRAQNLLDHMLSQKPQLDELIEMTQEMLALDSQAASWRQTPQWSFKTLQVSDLPECEVLTQFTTPMVELHIDIWNSYEWNYHRTARVIFLQQILKCLQAALNICGLDSTHHNTLFDMIQRSIATIYQLADGVLATVPQSFGDIDSLGRMHDSTKGPPKCRAVGAYLLLWPIKIIKSENSWTNDEQKKRAQIVFERIREYTGMKSLLGEKSCI